ncbi:feline leukemia virus subgroup C receptor-related protein 2-like [Harmonia axyridis]|uniref:feline leukemia virus subgroup C receptor-related protein 2-like n=1 Tax=Harmonia axyridis TaxID=115357 RepID=UPI001E277B61|nr:feline leukemia virus subgroup C receptor-related protein 2-like [Harmonia axyridis]
MDGYSEIEGTRNPKKPDIVLDSYRWVIVLIFAAFCGSNFFLFMQFTIIANVTKRYYNIDSFMTDATGLVFMGSYILFFIPVGHFIQQKNLKEIAVISSGLTAFGNFLKLFAVPPDRFYLIIISQAICGFAQVFMVSLPPKVASTWFGAEEVSIACAVGVMGCQIGLALGCVLSPYLVPDTLNMHEIAYGFSALFTIDNIVSITILILVVLFFKSKPDSPPSQSQMDRLDGDDEVGYLEAFKVFMKNKDYMMVLTTFGISYGVWNCLGIIVNEMFLHFFPGYGKNLGILILCGVVAGGVLGTVIFGYLLDKTHEFKGVANFVLVANFISWVCLIVAFQAKSLLGTSLLIPVMGFFSGSLVVIGFEYATEVTYPIPEYFSASLLNASIYIFAIVSVLVIECAFKAIGFLTGQIILAVLLLIASATSFLISSDYKRTDANLINTEITNYRSLMNDKLP